MEKYLIELLETNNRVIVPDLGAFIIRQQEPRELVFNDLLAFNDGMLTTHIKQQEGISMSKAQVKIEEFVDRVKKVLTKGDIYHLENLGYLKMDDSSKIEFSVTPFPAGRAAVVSAATLGQEEETEEASETQKPTPEEGPDQGKEISIEEEAPMSETPEEEAPVPDIPEEEDLVLEVTEEEAPTMEFPEEEAPVLEVSEEEDLVLDLPEEIKAEESAVPEIPIEEVGEKEAKAEEDAQGKSPEGDLTPEEDSRKADTQEEITMDIQEEAAESGGFTLEDQTADFEVDASEDKPLIPDAEEPPFMIEEQEKEEETRESVVGTSQARLQAAAEAAAGNELKIPEAEQEPTPPYEPSIPYYVERENRIRGIWPWVGGAAALIIILLVAAWFFFPEEVNGILGGKSSETVSVEEQIPDESMATGQETETAGEEETAAESEAETPPVQEEITQDRPEPEPAPPTAEQTGKYYIVAGMFSSRSNAENLVSTLKAQGYSAELFGRKNNLYAVSFSSHISRAEAQQELSRIREQANPKAWLLFY